MLTNISEGTEPVFTNHHPNPFEGNLWLDYQSDRNIENPYLYPGDKSNSNHHFKRDQNLPLQNIIGTKIPLL